MLLLDAASPQAAGLRGDGSDDERAVQPEAQWPSRPVAQSRVDHGGPWRATSSPGAFGALAHPSKQQLCGVPDEFSDKSFDKHMNLMG